MILEKTVVNDNGGTKVAADWMLTASGPTAFSGNGPQVANGAGFAAGTYTLSESGPSGYTASAWACSGGTQGGPETISLQLGDSATCSITNDDTAPTLRLIKTIVNDNGGTVTDENSFGLRINGQLALHDVPVELDAGDHQASEDGLPDYLAGPWGGACAADGSVVLEPGNIASCTITNDDRPPSLTLIKEVLNDGGGKAEPSDWILIANGPSGFSGPGPSVSSGDGLKMGTYDLSETGSPSNYTPGDWNCIGGLQVDVDTISLALGDIVTCTIVNDDPGSGPIIFLDGFEADE